MIIADFADGLTNILCNGKGEELLNILEQNDTFGRPILNTIASKLMSVDNLLEYEKTSSQMLQRKLLHNVSYKIFSKPFLKPEPKKKTWGQALGFSPFEDFDQDLLENLTSFRRLIRFDEDAFILFFYDEIPSSFWVERANSFYHATYKVESMRFGVLTMQKSMETLKTTVHDFGTYFSSWLESVNYSKISRTFGEYMDSIISRVKNMEKECEDAIRALMADNSYANQYKRFKEYENEEKARQEILRQERARQREIERVREHEREVERARERQLERDRYHQKELANIAAVAALQLMQQRSRKRRSRRSSRRRSSRNQKKMPSGSYKESCTDCTYDDFNRLTCLCKDKNGNLKKSTVHCNTIFPKKIYNDNGTLKELW
jgi:hypothetical protein